MKTKLPAILALAIVLAALPSGAEEDNTAADFAQAMTAGWQVKNNFRYRLSPKAKLEETSPGSLKLASGNLLIEALKPTTVELPLSKVVISRKALVLIKLDDGAEKVLVIWDDGFKSVHLVFESRKVNLGAGDEAIATGFEPRYHQILENDDIGHRRVRMHHLGKKNYLTTAEFSLLQALETNTLLGDITRSDDPHDRQMKERIIKTAAILSFVTRHHGTYSRGGRF